MTTPSAPRGRSVLSPVRVGESVARELRERILNGEYAERLPKQETLMADFEVSAPSIREAFRVLESEGLIVVRRGNVGGALIRLPSADDTAYQLGLALQAKGVRVSEVASALWQIDPTVARLCAQREDRLTAVVPQLAETIDLIQSTTSDDYGDPLIWEYKAQIFHDRMGELCGNGALNAVMASLYALYHSHLDEWTATHGSYASKNTRVAVVKDHRQILRMIEKGDGNGAARAAGNHLERLLTPLLDADEIVSVTLPRNIRSRRRRAATAAHAD
jgi:GntR family transcriptional regulator, transcriptional repressor for pyruvate dehydrogenase complex